MDSAAIRKKWHTARSILVLNKFRFWGTIAMRMDFVESNSIPTTAVDKEGRFVYNPEWTAKLSEEDTLFEFAHEVAHLFQRIHSRFPAGGHWPTWNLAADYSADCMLVKAGLVQSKVSHEMVGPKGLAIAEQYKTVPAIYKHLMEEREKQKKEGGGGEGEGKHTRCSPNFEELPAEVKGKFIRAVMSAKMEQGGASALTQAYINEMLTPKIDWKQYLLSALTERFQGRYCYGKLNRRSLGNGLMLPTKKPSPGGIVGVLDCSGSIGPELLTRCISELRGLCAQAGCENLYVIQHDVRVYNAGLYTQEEMRNLKPTWGGTSHVEVFEVIEGGSKKWKIPYKPQLVVCFTDLESNFPSSCSVPTIWVSNKKHPIPFGKYLLVDDK